MSTISMIAERSIHSRRWTEQVPKLGQWRGQGIRGKRAVGRYSLGTILIRLLPTTYASASAVKPQLVVPASTRRVHAPYHCRLTTAEITP